MEMKELQKRQAWDLEIKRVHLDKGQNRFQKMKITHPKQYEYCINKLGCGKVLDFINVKY